MHAGELGVPPSYATEIRLHSGFGGAEEAKAGAAALGSTARRAEEGGCGSFHAKGLLLGDRSHHWWSLVVTGGGGGGVRTRLGGPEGV